MPSEFTSLPPTTLHAVTMRTGPVRSVRDGWGGDGAGVAAVLATASGPVFVSGVPVDYPECDSYRQAAALAPYLPAVSPRLLWPVEAGGWFLLGWRAVHGTPADYRQPAVLRKALEALEVVQRVRVPEELGVESARERWGPYADEGDADLFAGDVLLHTDLVADNVVVSDCGVRLVNWVRPARGAGWVEPYLWALRLMAAGHSAASAVAWACRVASWREADPWAIRAFGAAVARRWHAITSAHGTAWKLHMAVQAAELRAYLALEPGDAEC